GSQGRNYADVASFEAAGVAPHFQDYHHPQYPQLHGAFEPFMSVIDLLYNQGPKSRETLMSANSTAIR
ncbi:MAG: WbqC family protein, partial [Candidatus Eremiobacteraeota bacterium]|nr:WbqC family protein [Candidatus Eremiobacteraeota bacterium]